jgi:hypothetical protein
MTATNQENSNINLQRKCTNFGLILLTAVLVFVLMILINNTTNIKRERIGYVTEVGSSGLIFKLYYIAVADSFSGEEKYYLIQSEQYDTFRIIMNHKPKIYLTIQDGLVLGLSRLGDIVYNGKVVKYDIV